MLFVVGMVLGVVIGAYVWNRSARSRINRIVRTAWFYCGKEYRHG